MPPDSRNASSRAIAGTDPGPSLGCRGGLRTGTLPPRLKALLVHGAEWPDTKLIGDGTSTLPLDRFLSYGWLAIDHVLGCPAYRVTVLAVGDLGARQEEDIIVPLPAGLSGLVGKRRVTATLAWLSPINWRHRQYRRGETWVSPAGGRAETRCRLQAGQIPEGAEGNGPAPNL